MSINAYHLKAVAHLNNIGVSLLQRHCYYQAMRTFSDAVSITKLMCSTECRITSEQEHAIGVQDKVREASQRFSNPKPLTVAKKIFLEVLSDSESPAVFYLGNSHSLANIAYPVRMELGDFETPSKNDLAVASSVILYNQGLAYRCIASLHRPDQCAETLDKAALRAFKIAHSALLSHDAFLVENDTQTQFHRFLLLSLLMLHHLTELTHRQGSECEHNYCSNCLDRIRHEIMKLVAVEPNFLARAAAAA
jgi:hypothetical protein